ncbi:Holliday junction DNA helicase subunit RuvA [Persephonella hydrogeniphila]|uniref:Holliday junction branch migration complex subunit RuvA n=1 Tax=Persephonella hydrogeniphila TaxID=198703 RepID=A0A285N2A3_9AQUI|nr:Holliday junction branch migration protein RuvA [Persephonella hydrogeniphila]SNZ03605.1 Holliday junction DNA helicase subunit RuvA [Persephonella hydrogeniphila]
MFEFIKGKIVEKREDYIVVEIGGVGFKVFSPSDFDTDEVVIYLKVRLKEDEILLYGFKNREERDIFEQLLSISGVGVKHAFSVLRRYTVDELLDILEEGDIDALTDVPGIGKKTAQRIVLELKGKIDFIKNELVEDIVQALVNLGFDKKESIKAAREAVKETKDIQKAVKKALQKLSESV